MSAGLAQRLWDGNADLMRAALTHPFIRGIATGDLPQARFAEYVAQDAYFLDAFSRAYALALAHSPDRDGLEAFARLLAGVLDELRLHASYAARWHIDLDAVRPLPATTAYTGFLLSTASRGDAGETCAALTPCMRLYAWLGQELARAPRLDGNPYAEWIATYGGADFAALVSELERLLDRYAETSDAVRGTYRQAMELEVAFFDAHLPTAAR
jgi:thiaminase/transcriptional activator TenA